MFKCLRVLIDVKQGANEVLCLSERNLGMREERGDERVECGRVRGRRGHRGEGWSDHVLDSEGHSAPLTLQGMPLLFIESIARTPSSYPLWVAYSVAMPPSFSIIQ